MDSPAPTIDATDAVRERPAGKHPEPFGLDLDHFLSGAAEGRDLDVDDVFAKDFEDMLADLRLHQPEGLEPLGDPRGVPSLSAPGYRLLHVACGVIALSPDGGPVGGYLGCDLSVDAAHRGAGLGRELVIERALADGSLPTWHLDDPAYSGDGVACHEAAWRHARAHPSETALRASRIASI